MSWLRDDVSGRYRWIDDATGQPGFAPPGTPPPPGVSQSNAVRPVPANLYSSMGGPSRGVDPGAVVYQPGAYTASNAGGRLSVGAGPARPVGQFTYDPNGNIIGSRDFAGNEFDTEGLSTGVMAPVAAPVAAPTAGQLGTPRIQTPTRRTLQQRLEALVQAGRLDPGQLIGPDGRLRPEVVAMADSVEPYTGGNLDGGGGTGDVFINPAELAADTVAQQTANAERGALATRSGFYFDPATEQWRPTAGYSTQLLGTIGNARAAEDNYRRQLNEAGARQTVAQGQIGSAEQGVNAAVANARRTGGGYNPSAQDEANIALARQGVNQAQMAYARSRGAMFGTERPVGLDATSRGMTDQQYAGYEATVRNTLSPEDFAALTNTSIPEEQLSPYARQYRDYRRIRAARL